MRISDWSSDVCSSVLQPTFFDLYGFFPGSFVGNPDLKPDSSRGGGISLRYASDLLGGSVTYFRQRLNEEIATVFLPDFTDRKRVVLGKRLSARVDFGGRRIIKPKKTKEEQNHE